MDEKEYFRKYDGNTPEFTLKGLKTIARVVSIYDADTVKLVIPVMGCCFKFNVRLLGIDTCEMKAKNEKNREMAVKARDRLFELVTGRLPDLEWKKKEIEAYLNKDVYVVWVDCEDYDKWGRVLAHVYPSITGSPRKSFSQSLIEEKLAYAYKGETKLSEEDQIAYLISS
jgi:endonuclease YncB( thermonuclease family)